MEINDFLFSLSLSISLPFFLSASLFLSCRRNYFSRFFSFLNPFKNVDEYAVRNGILGVSSFNHKNSTEYSVFKRSLRIRWFDSLVCAPMKDNHFRALFIVVKVG